MKSLILNMARKRQSDDDKVNSLEELYALSDDKKIVDNLVRQNIRIKLREAKKNQRWLAQKLGKSEPHLSQYLSMNGKALASLLPSIAVALGVRPYDLIQINADLNEATWTVLYRKVVAAGVDINKVIRIVEAVIGSEPVPSEIPAGDTPAIVVGQPPSKRRGSSER